MDAMLDYSSDELKTSLTKLKGVNAAQNVEMAILQFKNIMGYMGDRPSMYRDVFVDEVRERGAKRRAGKAHISLFRA